MTGPCSWLYEASRRWPKKEAVFDEESSLRFGDLYEDSLRAAGWLGLKGRLGQRVVIVLPFSVSAAVLYFGTLFAGMVAVPVDSGLGSERLGHLLEEIDPLLVIGVSVGRERVECLTVDEASRAVAPTGISKEEMAEHFLRG